MLCSSHFRLTVGSAKVLLKTSAGDLEIELWGKECPLATRNFLQHCLDDYYTGTIFHRIVPGFILQGGDPSGTGDGGDSIYPEGTFADEFSNRLRFNRRGLLGMANSGGKDENGSQFFFTLAPAMELNGKNTMFGRIVGDTIYNLVKMTEREIEGERMVYPVKIVGAEILVNPFEDLVRRVKEVEVKPEETKKAPVKKTKKKPGKKILSFGDEEGEADLPAKKKIKFDSRLVADAPPVSTGPSEVKKKQSSPPPLRREPSPKPIAAPQTAAPKSSTKKSPSRSPSASPEPQDYRSKKLEETNQKIASIKDSLKRTGPATETSKAPESTNKKSAKALIEAFLPETSVKGRRKMLRKGRDAADDETWDALAKFQARLKEAKMTAKPEETSKSGPSEDSEMKDSTADDNEGEADLCDLHFVPNCQSCKWHDAQSREASPEPGLEGIGWMAHNLSFEKDRLGKDLEWKRKNEEELVVIDPREKEKELKDKRKGGGGGAFRKEARGGGGQREWDKRR